MTPIANRQPNTSVRALWLFGLTILPYGAGTNFIQTTAPFLLNKAGIPVHNIASISAICRCPFFLSFLWAPLVDLGWKRRNVIVLSGICAAAALNLATLVLPSRNLVAFTALATLTVALSTFSSAATGGLMATLVQVEHRGRAGGWFQVGIMAGGALSAGITMWSAGKFGIAETVLLDLAAGSWGAWALAGAQVIYATLAGDHGATAPESRMFDPATGKTRILSTLRYPPIQRDGCVASPATAATPW